MGGVGVRYLDIQRVASFFAMVVTGSRAKTIFYLEGEGTLREGGHPAWRKHETGKRTLVHTGLRSSRQPVFPEKRNV